MSRALMILAMLLAASTAGAAERVALVIGNTAYEHTRVLPNARNDARAIAAVLKRIGFEVTEASDLGYRVMRDTIRVFGRAAQAAEVAVVYYAGHGLEVAGENYLVPVDAKVLSDADLEYEAVTLASLLETLRARRKLSLVILDACRNNPLSDRIQLRTGITRSVSRGLARVEPPRDILVAFAAEAGTLAQDGTGANSPYAEALIKHLPTPGVDVRLLMGRVRDMVLASTTPPQVPYISGSLGGSDIVLVPPPATQSSPAQAAAAEPTAQTAEQEAAAAWTTIKDTKSTAELEAFIARFGPTFHGDLAKARLAELRQVAILAEEKQPTAAKKAAEGSQSSSPDPALSVAPGSGHSFRDTLADGQLCPFCPEMVVVPAGEFLMGSLEWENKLGVRRTAKQVSHPFAVGRFAVTFDEWDACVADGGCKGYRPGDHGWGRGRRPVINVNWHDAKAFTKWLSSKTGKIYRLLSDDEREYVTRAGTTTPFWWGNSISTGQANYDGDYAYGTGFKGENRRRTVPVGSFPPNPWGLFDVHGNVSEWIEDSWNSGVPGIYGQQPSDGTRLFRGGSWSDYPSELTSDRRSRAPADDRAIFRGFRVARAL